GQVEKIDKQFKGGIQVIDSLTHQRQVERWAVFRKQLAIAIIDQPPGRRERLYPYTVVFRASDISLVLDDLEIYQAPHQRSREKNHDNRCQSSTQTEGTRCVFG